MSKQVFQYLLEDARFRSMWADNDFVEDIAAYFEDYFKNFSDIDLHPIG